MGFFVIISCNLYLNWHRFFDRTISELTFPIKSSIMYIMKLLSEYKSSDARLILKEFYYAIKFKTFSFRKPFG